MPNTVAASRTPPTQIAPTDGQSAPTDGPSGVSACAIRIARYATDGVDRGVESFLHAARRLPSLTWMAPALAPAASLRAGGLVRDTQPRVMPLVAGVLAQQPGAIAAYDQLVAAAVDDLRRVTTTGWRGLVHRFDHWFYRDIPEMEDDPAFPMAQRQAIIHTIHRFNHHAGSYDRFIRCLEPLILAAEAEHGGPVRMVDLAAGAGGLACALKERFGERVEVTATDVSPDFLAWGRQMAQERRLNVDFSVQDATDLRNLEDRQFDVVICTQALHHFPAGMAARMLGQASRVARSAVCFIDGEREPIYAALLGAVMGAYGRTWPVVYDTVASVRRMYTREELDLLATLIPGMPTHWEAKAQRLSPGHLTVVMRPRGQQPQDNTP